jgi:hypothetical protein
LVVFSSSIEVIGTVTLPAPPCRPFAPLDTPKFLRKHPKANFLVSTAPVNRADANDAVVGASGCAGAISAAGGVAAGGGSGAAAGNS